VERAGERWRRLLLAGIARLRHEGSCTDVELVAGAGPASFAHSIVLGAARCKPVSHCRCIGSRTAICPIICGGQLCVRVSLRESEKVSAPRTLRIS
jgi:hypothetical protein